ncbi:Serine/threonine-protein kinase BUD32 [Dioszegia hungarica]|uniref:EKC/KEOPS complex subunit BUD32 n=1 Tax=Dioszegia hungarica TaxID=4972 RepID=A0AA38H7Q3_9TREE|nr:Serine/threonine-protein kinase BUD32 [Dioszegia hungarica]KAI9635950.1 Serine/threonine-protein kinase BUD32 [Dioszegia hungarica]
MASTVEPTPFRSASRDLLDSATLIKQGAEARVYALSTHLAPPSVYWPPSSTPSSSNSTPFPPSPALILKHRFPKTYRHPTLDATLTKSRLSFEARALARCLKAGVVVPRVMWVDEREGVLGMEKVEGWSVREILGGGAEGEVEVDAGEAEEEVEEGMERLDVDGEAGGVEESEGWIALKGAGISQEYLMAAIGAALARLHSTGIIHGDLTTSNMMIRLTPGKAEAYDVVMIDFGLSSQAVYVENYAVDLYVLERAFGSTHPASEGLFAGVLEAYGKGMGKKWADIERRLKDVRMRGRKRDMTG